MTEATISKHMKYNMAHREQRKAYAKQHYQEHKEEHKAKMKAYKQQNYDLIYAKVICDNCGASICKHGLAKHKRTKKCIQTSSKQCGDLAG